jgi:hypothetical protein
MKVSGYWKILALCLLVMTSLAPCCAEESIWKKAELHRKFIQDEGLLNPEDWVLIFLIPRGVYYRTVSKDPEEKNFAEQIGGSPLNADEGKTFIGRTMIQFQIGGRDRLKAVLSGKALTFKNIEERFWVEWNRFPKGGKGSLKHPYPRKK